MADSLKLKKSSSKTNGKYGFYLGFLRVSITRRNFYPPLNEHGKGEIIDKIGEKVRKKRLKDVFCMLIFIFALVGMHSILAPKFAFDYIIMKDGVAINNTYN